MDIGLAVAAMLAMCILYNMLDGIAVDAAEAAVETKVGHIACLSEDVLVWTLVQVSPPSLFSFQYPEHLVSSVRLVTIQANVAL